MTGKSYERVEWAHKSEFLLSMLGYCVGLGNVWRFPYLAYDTGGGAFLVPYFIMLFFAGIPMMMLEMSIGQYSSQGTVTVWNSVPLMRGIGFGILIAVSMSKMSSMLITAYSFYYLFASFKKKLPWTNCHNDWNTKLCSQHLEQCLDNLGIVTKNGSCVQIANLTPTELELYGITKSSGNWNLTDYEDPFAGQRMRPSEEYWNLRVRQESSSMNYTGGIVWEIVLCLLLSWLTVFLCLIKGIKSSGKVVYVTAIFPYIILTIFLILGLTLPGHQDGIKFFIYPKWELLKTPRAWLNAAVQIFFSLGASWGGVITLSSYNKFHNNIHVDSILISIANSATSIWAGFVIFSVLGYMAHELKMDVSTVVTQGYGLAFIIYPEAIALLPVPPIWSILFFLMLISLALDSHFAGIEVIVTAIVDLLPKRWKRYKLHILAMYCMFGFLQGLICTTRAGPYWANLIDQSSIGFTILLFAFLETFSISWIYGFRRFKNDIRSMIGDRFVDSWTSWIWIFQWCFTAPLLLAIVLFLNFVGWTYPTYNGPFPQWAMALSWLITGATFIPIPLVILYSLLSTPGSFKERWHAVTSPHDTWGPRLQHHRDHAWKCHETHGTTMGGKPVLQDVNEDEENYTI